MLNAYTSNQLKSHVLGDHVLDAAVDGSLVVNVGDLHTMFLG